MEKENTKVIEIIKDKYRVEYFYQAKTKDFKLEERRVIVNPKTKGEREDWIPLGWFYNMKEVLKYIIRSCILEENDISTLEKYIDMQNEMIDKINKMEV